MATLNSTAPEPATSQNLLARERRIATEHWSLLNEMRLHDELPEWVKTNFPMAGTHAEADEIHNVKKLVDKAVSGDIVPCRYGLGRDMDGLFYLHGSGGEVEFQGSAVDLASKSGVMEQLTAHQLTSVACGIREYAKKLEASHE